VEWCWNGPCLERTGKIISYKLCLFTFKQIGPWLIEQDDVISYERTLKMDFA